MAEISVFTVVPQKNDSPFTPFVHVCWLSDYSSDGDGKTLLSPQLMTDKEVDESIDGLIQQLEKARKKAKKDLRTTNKR